MRRAVLAYNHAGWYADQVLALSECYTTTLTVLGSAPVDGYALPAARHLLTPALIHRPHHTYPAWDLALPVGTPVYAVAGGRVVAATNDGRCGRGVIIDGHDHARYTYCHANTVTVTRGQTVAAGAQILTSGNTGRSTGPHLHLQIRAPGGPLVYPQPLLDAWYRGQAASPTTAPTAGCVR